MMKGICTQSNTLNKNSTYLPFHISLIKTRASIVVALWLLKPMDRPWWAFLLALRLKYMWPTMSDMCPQAHYYDSSTCHQRQVTCAHKHTIKTPVHATHDEWHVHMGTLLSLQYMPPTVSDMCAWAHYFDSRKGHPWWVTCAHKHITKTPVRATHGEWHVRMSMVLSL